MEINKKRARIKKIGDNLYLKMKNIKICKLGPR